MKVASPIRSMNGVSCSYRSARRRFTLWFVFRFSRSERRGGERQRLLLLRNLCVGVLEIVGRNTHDWKSKALDSETDVGSSWEEERGCKVRGGKRKQLRREGDVGSKESIS